ncbi:MAG: THUMP domain-containing protein, partial [Candidatus Aenigmatarchaeota archaeon]
MYEKILLGIDEIWIKSEKIRKIAIKNLLEDIKKRINFYDVKEKRGRIIINSYKDDWIEILKKVFGIKTIYPAISSKSELEEIKKKVLEILKNHKGSFKIETKRIYKKFPLNSLEINRELGKYIEENLKLKVDVKNPEKIVYVEIHENETYIYDKVIYGIGGLNLGFEGKGLVLFSGGIDSSLASIFMGKRGMNLDFLFINIAGEFYLNYVFRIFQKLKEYFPDAKLFVYDLDLEKLLKVRKGYKQIMFKVLMYKIAEAFAKENSYDAIVSGESLGQTATQTIESLILLNSLVSIPVFRPLIGMNKDEIIKLAKEFGFFELRAPEICEIEKYPTTKPKKEIVLNELEKLSIDFNEEIKKVKVIENFEIEQDILNLPKRNEVEIINLDLVDVKNLNLEKNKKYLFICKSGILARSIAEKFKKMGYETYYLDLQTAKSLKY